MHNLITGGAGFVGSHLIEALLKRGQRVTVLDDLSTGSVENVARSTGSSRSLYFRLVMDRHLLLS